MPELPEIETLKRQLIKTVLGLKILDIKIFDKKKIKINQIINNSIIMNIQRYGKNLYIDLSNEKTIIINLRMTGSLQLITKENYLRNLIWNNNIKHIRLIILLSIGSIYLIDPRRFATFIIINKNQHNLEKFSYDALLSDIDYNYFQKISKNKKQSLKNFLLDQKNIQGLGNIYVNEVLFLVKINPTVKINSITDIQWQFLIKKIKFLLKIAIKHRGTSSVNWRDLFGEKGNFQLYLNVYKRNKLPCLNCNTIIKKIYISGRSTFYCSQCQKK